MYENSYEPPALDLYYDHVVHHLEIELTAEGIAAEATFMRESDRVRLRASEDPEATLEAILAHLRDGLPPAHEDPAL